MPGLRYLGPPFSTHGNSPYHSGLYTPPDTDYAWDFVDLNHVQLPAVEALPFVPNKHKAWRPPQLQAGWMLKGKEEPQAGLLSPKQWLMNGNDSAQCNGSNDSEDLAAMVHDFIESDTVHDFYDGSDSDGGSPSIAALCERLQVLTSAAGSLERDLLCNVTILVLAINEDTDLVCNTAEGAECKGGCTKRVVVKYLRAAGYNAAVCKSKWQSSGGVPGGEYEYIDVVFDGDQVAKRLIVDVDFQAQFEIARPTQHYMAALKPLPTVFVGTTSDLEQVLEIMSEAAKVSLKQNSMHLPPWRTLEYMCAKWLSPYERKMSDLFISPHKGPCSLHWRDVRPITPETKQCGELLRRTKVSLLAEVKGSTLSSLARGRGGAFLLRKKRSIL